MAQLRYKLIFSEQTPLLKVNFQHTEHLPYGDTTLYEGVADLADTDSEIRLHIETSKPVNVTDWTLQLLIDDETILQKTSTDDVIMHPDLSYQIDVNISNRVIFRPLVLPEENKGTEDEPEKDKPEEGGEVMEM